MNKSQLIEAVASQMESSKADASRAIEAVLACIEDGLKTDNKVAISGFGTFVRKNRPARKAVNPATKREMDIPASNTAGFRAAQSLKERL